MLNFIQYHNAVPIAISVLLLGGASAFAATNPEAIYAEQQHVLSIDNTYLANKDFGSWTPQIRISSVTEDQDNYQVAYALTTIDLDGYAWKDVVKNETMSVSKADLGRYRDLGVYVTQQLRQIIDRELQRLKETQSIEKQNVSLATVSTTYSGLVGALLTDSTETLPGYTPVVVEPSSSQVASAGGAVGGSPSSGQSSGGTGSSSEIGLQVLGNNPARIAVNTGYIDLGVALIDPLNTNVGVHTFVDGKEVVTPSLDTSTSTVYAIEYRATDRSGSTIMTRRIVIVGGAADPGGEISEAGNVSPVAPAPAPAPAAAATQTQLEPAAAVTPVEPAPSGTAPTPTEETPLAPAVETSVASSTDPTPAAAAPDTATATSSSQASAPADTAAAATATSTAQ